jgi:predicted RNase H-like HicB family nuclease
MTVRRKYSLVIEGDPNGYSAYVPELPSILVTGRTMEELTVRAGEAIRVYWEHMCTERSATSTLREIEVDVPV